MGHNRRVPRFSRAELESFRGLEVPDLIGPGLRLLFVGINPSLWTAATHAHFARPGNRFYPALHSAGITPWLVNAAAGMSEEDRAMMLKRGVGITNLVRRATARADELTRAELQAGGTALTDFVREYEPRVVAVAGITAYRTGLERPHARPGRQPEDLAGAALWVVPNPSGLNAHETVDTLARAYAEPACAAGLLGR